MTVKELREELTKYPEDMLVTYSTDWNDSEVHCIEIQNKNAFSNPFGQDILRII